MDYDLKDTTSWEYMFPLEEDYEEQGLKVDLPASWVKRLSLSPQEYELRCPNGMRKLQLANEELQKLVSVTHTYKHRKDCLLKYVFFPGTAAVPAKHDFMYGPGHSHSVRRHVYTEESPPTRRLTFYAGARVDGLLERFEDNTAITETYKDRKDNLLM